MWLITVLEGARVSRSLIRREVLLTVLLGHRVEQVTADTCNWLVCVASILVTTFLRTILIDSRQNASFTVDSTELMWLLVDAWEHWELLIAWDSTTRWVRDRGLCVLLVTTEDGFTRFFAVLVDDLVDVLGCVFDLRFAAVSWHYFDLASSTFSLTLQSSTHTLIILQLFSPR